MPLNSLIVILFFCAMVSCTTAYLAFVRKISSALTFFWFSLCIIVAFFAVDNTSLAWVCKIFSANPSTVILSVFVVMLIGFIFYLLIKVNRATVSLKNLVQEITIRLPKREGGVGQVF
jgi:hypothetical protein